MGCIPSKQAALEADCDIAHSSERVAWKASQARRRDRALAKKARALESPIVEGEAPPWVAGHAVLTKRDGEFVVVERKDL